MVDAERQISFSAGAPPVHSKITITMTISQYPICYRAGTPRPLICGAKSRPFWKLVGGKGEEEERRLAAEGAVSVSPIRFLSLVDFLLFAIVLVFVDIRRIQHFFKCSITRFIICLLVFTEELLLTSLFRLRFKSY